MTMFVLRNSLMSRTGGRAATPVLYTSFLTLATLSCSTVSAQPRAEDRVVPPWGDDFAEGTFYWEAEGDVRRAFVLEDIGDGCRISMDGQRLLQSDMQPGDSCNYLWQEVPCSATARHLEGGALLLGLFLENSGGMYGCDEVYMYAAIASGEDPRILFRGDISEAQEWVSRRGPSAAISRALEECRESSTDDERRAELRRRLRRMQVTTLEIRTCQEGGPAPAEILEADLDRIEERLERDASSALRSLVDMEDDVGEQPSLAERHRAMLGRALEIRRGELRAVGRRAEAALSARRGRERRLERATEELQSALPSGYELEFSEEEVLPEEIESLREIESRVLAETTAIARAQECRSSDDLRRVVRLVAQLEERGGTDHTRCQRRMHELTRRACNEATEVAAAQRLLGRLPEGTRGRRSCERRVERLRSQEAERAREAVAASRTRALGLLGQTSMHTWTCGSFAFRLGGTPAGTMLWITDLGVSRRRYITSTEESRPGAIRLQVRVGLAGTAGRFVESHHFYLIPGREENLIGFVFELDDPVAGLCQRARL
jgi:hypothetical protein